MMYRSTSWPERCSWKEYLMELLNITGSEYKYAYWKYNHKFRFHIIITLYDWCRLWFKMLILQVDFNYAPSWHEYLFINLSVSTYKFQSLTRYRYMHHKLIWDFGTGSFQITRYYGLKSFRCSQAHCSYSYFFYKFVLDFQKKVFCFWFLAYYLCSSYFHRHTHINI